MSPFFRLAGCGRREGRRVRLADCRSPGKADSWLSTVGRGQPGAGIRLAVEQPCFFYVGMQVRSAGTIWESACRLHIPGGCDLRQRLGIAAVGGLHGRVAGRVRSLDDLYLAAVASSRMDVESNLTLAPVSCGTTSEATSQPHKKARHQVVEYTARGRAGLGDRGTRSRHARCECHWAEKDLLNTWTKYHLEWFGDSIDPFPLTKEILIAVAAMFKCGKCRSFSKYLSRAKEEHIRRGHAWSHLLDWISRQYSRYSWHRARQAIGGPLDS